jgi:hypothetical protein
MSLEVTIKSRQSKEHEIRVRMAIKSLSGCNELATFKNCMENELAAMKSSNSVQFRHSFRLFLDDDKCEVWLMTSLSEKKRLIAVVTRKESK